MKTKKLNIAKYVCGYLVTSFILWTNGGWIPCVFAAANVFPTGPKKVTVGQTFNVVFNTSGAKDVDTVRLNGSFTNEIFDYKASKPAGVFQNVSPGTYVDQAKGIFSFGAFTLSSRANGNSALAVLTFRAKKVGSGFVQLTTNSKMLSAGEEQIGSIGRLNIEVVEAKNEPEQPRPLPSIVPEGEAAIRFLSPTHPNPDLWYSNREVDVTWEIKGKKLNKAYFGFDETPEGASELVVIPTTSTHITLPGDGVYYAHLTLAFADGSIKREHLRIQIDQTAPTSVAIQSDQDLIPSSIPNKLRFGALDKTSGISKYEVSLNGIAVTTTALSFYDISNLNPMKYEAKVEAIDYAGNRTAATTTFEVIKQHVITPQIQTNQFDTSLIMYLLALIIIAALLILLGLTRHKKQENISTNTVKVIPKKKKTKNIVKLR
ncbi:hypothetical protein IT408_00850 [Candidatus Uhrbacteria bacterium]|nr:hypothetical protein [Candidatus Uhrbacteria bacterium]